MSRGLGVVEAVGAALPDAAVVLFALVTQLGDLWFYFVAISLLYWFAGAGRLRGALDRRRAAFLVALALLALSATVALKALFALPRPPGAAGVEAGHLIPPAVRPVYVEAATADGYGFPSGHALAGTLVWGGAALVLGVGERRRRYAAAAAVVALIAFSRVALGVHYLVDVLAGVAVGVVLLFVAAALADAGRRPGRAFSLALAAALVAVLVGGYARDPIAALGAALGARITWGAVGGAVLELDPIRRRGTVLAGIGLPVFGGLFGATLALDLPLPGVLVASAAVLAGVLALPLAADRSAG